MFLEAALCFASSNVFRNPSDEVLDDDQGLFCNSFYDDPQLINMGFEAIKEAFACVAREIVPEHENIIITLPEIIFFESR
jgi:hypothetical protein